MSDRPRDLKAGAVARFTQSIRAVLWSFFGVRKGKDHERDLASLNPLHVIVAGVVCAAMFIGILLVVVHWVTQPTS
ncbi:MULTISPECIES: DUF2970 domain-containing protein [Burkholderiaceae]|uniref:DUF2970 domain-containing protein n=1 Tax=Burkholderiaceae TaxID=119060 RepID=UPI0009672108|nr:MULTISPECIES: DUF2970 domain-containing protein [Burkholderiaceae]MCG1019490.1 DUF2970 domain-containing protein [Mycetohabitans sp. B4]SIT71906.1 Protein of unknown function [Burkholderia sp. b13]